MNIGLIFTRHATYRSDHTALIFQNQRITYSQYNESINRLANAMLQMGVQKGTKVATILPNCIELLEIYWAAAKIGAIVVPMSTLLLANALRSLLNDSDANLIISNTAFADILNQIKRDLTKVPADRYILTDATNTDGFHDYHALIAAADSKEPQNDVISGDDPFNIMYSSGTTGLSKGIIHTHTIRIAYGTSFAGAGMMNGLGKQLFTGAALSGY